MSFRHAPSNTQQPLSKRVCLPEPGGLSKTMGLCERDVEQDEPTTSRNCDNHAPHPTGERDTPEGNGNEQVQSVANTPDNSGLRRFLTSRDKIFMEKFSEKMAGLHKVIADLRSEVGDIRYELISVKSHVDILMLMGEADGAGNGVAANGRTDSSTRCDTLLTHFSLIFRREVIIKVVLTSIVYTLSTGGANCNDHPSSSMDCSMLCVSKVGSALVASMLFGKRATMSKAVLQFCVGKEYCKLRKFIVLSLIRNTQLNSFGQFDVSCGANGAFARNGMRESTSTAHINATTSDQAKHVSPGCILQPAWIRPNVITNVHIEQVRSRLEKRMEKPKALQSRRKNKDAHPTDEEVSVRAVDRIYSIVTAHLHKSRDRARTIFFDEIGYALVAWSDHSLPNHLEEPVVSWAYAEGTDTTLPVPSVPMTVVTQREEHMANSYKENSRLLGMFLQQSLYMIVSVEHDVMVVQDSSMVVDQFQSPSFSSASGAGTTPEVAPTVRKRVRRLVNLVEVALKFLNAYSGSSLDIPIVSILGADASVLKAAFVVASTFRSIVQSFMDSPNLHLDTETAPYTSPSRSNVRCEGISLVELLPTPSMRHKTFLKMVLSMTEADYAVHHVAISHTRKNPSSTSNLHGEDVGEGGNELVEGLDFVLCM